VTRRVLYVAHCLRPTEDEIRSHPAWRERPGPGDASFEEVTLGVLLAHLASAQRWLAWLRKRFPETTFIAPWIASVVAGADDADPAQRDAGMVDACAVVERCDGIVLCGRRFSSGMRREMEHGRRHHSHVGDPSYPVFQVYDLTDYAIEGASGRNEDGRTFEQWMRGYQESCTR
jgi:hypothetical protein